VHLNLFIHYSVSAFEDVVAYVDVWSASRMEDYSDPFIQQLLSMGAEVITFLSTVLQIKLVLKCKINDHIINCRYRRHSTNK